MSRKGRGPEINRVFLLFIALLLASLLLPGEPAAGRAPRLYLISQLCLSIGAMILAVAIALKRSRDSGS
ncbi:MAG: hypothetical protein PVJ01_05505, partial [Pseudomonadota bacterium]